MTAFIWLRPVYSDATQLDVELNSVELRRYKWAFTCMETWIASDVHPKVTMNDARCVTQILGRIKIEKCLCMQQFLGIRFDRNPLLLMH